MKYTHDRHFNIVPIDTDNMDRNYLINYASLRPIWDTEQEAKSGIEMYKPQWVSTWTDWMWYWA